MPSAADDFDGIARRLREIQGQKRRPEHPALTEYTDDLGAAPPAGMPPFLPRLVH